MATGVISDKDLSAIRAQAKSGKVKDLGVEIVNAAQKEARALAKKDGVTDPVALEKVRAGNVRKDPDGNWLFDY